VVTVNTIGAIHSVLIRPYLPDDLNAIHALITAAAQTDRTPRILHEALRAIPDPEYTTTIAILSNGTIGGFAWWDFAKALAYRP
jgi:hypothetical protein